jgi:ABC-type amino acid transport substrate-binding protein
MYSDLLFTNQNLINSDLNAVLAFKKASLKGWEYAYSNIEESADLILKKYNTEKLEKDELIYEGNELKKLSYFKTVTLGEIKKDKIQRIYDLYNVMGLIPVSINIEKFVFDIDSLSNYSFSEREKKYIEEKDNIKMCVLPDSMPYGDIKDGKLTGAISDYMALIEKKIGKSLSLIPTSSWAESLEFAENRKCDILSSLSWTKQREDHFNFTKPYIEIPYVLLTKNGTSFINNLSSLKNKKISVIDSYTIIDLLQSKYKDIEFVKVKNIDEGLEKVLKGETFGHIDAMSAAWYKLQTKYLTQIAVSAKLDEVTQLSIAIRNDDEVLSSIFQKAVLSIDDLTKDEIINKWISVEYKKEFDSSILWKSLLIIFIGFLALSLK